MGCLDTITYDNFPKQKDDVCEWKYNHPFGDFPSCKNVNSISRDRNWKFCPYCGKKIKVVEQMDYTDEYHDCLDYMECEECPYYYADLDQESKRE